MTDENKSKVVPFEEFAMEDADTEKKKHAFPRIAEGLYEVICHGVKMVEGKAYKSEELITQFEWDFELVKNLADPTAELVDTEGKPLEKTQFPVWSGLNQTRITKFGPQLTRTIMTALMGVPIDAGLGVIKPTAFEERRCKLYVEIGQKTDGSEKNIFKKFTPLKIATGGQSEVAPQNVTAPQDAAAQQ